MSRLMEALPIKIKESAPDMIAAINPTIIMAPSGGGKMVLMETVKTSMGRRPGSKKPIVLIPMKKERQRRIPEKNNPATIPQIATPSLLAAKFRCHKLC